jgi:hypothetical protein
MIVNVKISSKDLMRFNYMLNYQQMLTEKLLIHFKRI